MRGVHLSATVVIAGVSIATGQTGCERGCLASWLGEHGVGGVDPPAARPSSHGDGGSGPRGSAGHAAGVDLAGTDCSDGLARCNDGRVEVSLAGHVPDTCSAAKELPGACTCPWQPAGTCEAGCVKDGLEVVAEPAVAKTQLCKAQGVARPATPADSANVLVCAEDGVSCVDGKVRSCSHRGQPSTVLVVCTHGCAGHVTLDVDDVGPGDGAAEILCRRDHAEHQ